MCGCPSIKRLLTVALCTLVLASCGTSAPRPPYPAYVVVDELPDAFVAGLPGVRAKQLATDVRTQRASYRVLIPSDWHFSTGASPGQSVEIFVLAGAVDIGEFRLDAGGYAWLPSGMSGTTMKSDNGAMILYFLDEADDASVIRTPLITNSQLIEWKPADVGVDTKTLREDPGSGARTWLVRIGPDAILPWQRSTRDVEGYLLSGGMLYSECVGANAGTHEYLPGGYFHRPPGAIHGGPASTTAGSATWYLRVTGRDAVESVDGCAVAAEDPATF